MGELPCSSAGLGCRNAPSRLFPQEVAFSSTRVYGSQLTNLRVLPPLAPGAPERVVLERIPELELGRAYNLTCRVLNVAPVRHLTVTLRQGGRILHTETFQNHTRAGPDNVTVTKEITPQQRDHGQEVTCHAALDLTPHEPHFENSSSAVELKVYGEFLHAPCAVHTTPCTGDPALSSVHRRHAL